MSTPERDAAIAKANERLEELAALEQGWLGASEGDKVTAEAIAYTKDIVAHCYSDNEWELDWVPALFPTPEGGISIEVRTPTMLKHGFLPTITVTPQGTVEAWEMADNLKLWIQDRHKEASA